MCNRIITFRIITFVIMAMSALMPAVAQKMWINGHWVDINAIATEDSVAVRSVPPSVPLPASVTPPRLRHIRPPSVEQRIDSIYAACDTVDVTDRMLGAAAYLPAVFDRYDMFMMTERDTLVTPADTVVSWGARRFADRVAADRRRARMSMQYMIANPQMVRYNSAFFDTPAKIYRTTFDPTTAQINIEEIADSLLNNVEQYIAPPVIHRRNWLNTFDGLVQFTQAYNSPNWYQGGNSNLNMLVQAVYQLNLNTKFHPDLLFENTLQYKLALTSAPEDEFRNYSINEDLLQFNTKFGIRAARYWFYTVSGQLKTQTLRNYTSNTNDLKAAFMSPGEVNVGVGMTYTRVNKKETFSFGLTISPLSYNLKTCLEDRVDGTAFGIRPGHRTDNQFGANIEAKLVWKIAYNIQLSTRLYAFTDYNYVQGDLENTLSFSINRFLSTQIYAHLRYDSQTPALADSRWHKWQLKEIFSFGFAYKFAYT